MDTKMGKVFICDDDLGILDMLELIVESSGAEVYKEANSERLYARLEQVKPELLIIDLWMPTMPGDAIIRRLKADERFNDLHVLCISASVNGEKIARSAGADEFLPKPFDMQDILSVVDKVFESKRHSA